MLFVGRCMDTLCNEPGLRVSPQADLFQVPHRITSLSTDGWQRAAPQCLHSYAVTQSGAQRLLDALRACPGRCPADMAPAVMADSSDIFTISPAVFTQSTALRLLKQSFPNMPEHALEQLPVVRGA